MAAFKDYGQGATKREVEWGSRDASRAGLVPVAGFILWVLVALVVLAQQPSAGW